MAGVAAAVVAGQDDPAAPAPTAAPSPVEPTLEPTLEPTGEPTAEPTEEPAPLACAYLPSGTPARPVTPPPVTPELPDEPVPVLLRTSVGDVPLELTPATAPCAVASFLNLARQGYYTGTPCHRLVDRGVFVLQCGDPTGTGQGGPGYVYDEELLPETAYPRGTVAVVNSGPGTSGSQFFLVHDDSPLPAQYSVLGRVLEPGLEVLDAVAQAGAGLPDENGNTPPNLPVRIDAVELPPAPAPSVTPTP